MWAKGFARRCGAYIALAALTLQLALSFAHVHKQDLAFSRWDRSASVSVGQARSALQTVARPLADDDDHCPICFSGFLLSNSSLPAAPVNPRQLQFAQIDCALHPISDRVPQPRCAAFLSRGPPSA